MGKGDQVLKFFTHLCVCVCVFLREEKGEYPKGGQLRMEVYVRAVVWGGVGANLLKRPRASPWNFEGWY